MVIAGAAPRIRNSLIFGWRNAPKQYGVSPHPVAGWEVMGQLRPAVASSAFSTLALHSAGPFCG